MASNAGYRQVHPEMWDDPFFLELSPDEKLLFIYMFTNARTSLSGLYEISRKQIAFHTGLDNEFIKETLLKFQKLGKILHSDSVFFVVNQFKRHFSKSPKVETRVKNDINEIKDCEPKRVCIRVFEELMGYPYCMDSEPHKEEDKEEDESKNEDEDVEKKNTSSSPNFIGEFVTAVRVKFTNHDQAQAIKDLVDDYGEEPVLQAATWYGQNNPRNMGHALKSIDTALSRGWDTGKKDDIEEHNKKVAEAFLNGN